MLHVELSTEAKQGWKYTPRIYGASMTTLAEVIGLELAKLDGPRGSLPKHWREWLKQAADIAEIHDTEGRSD